MKLKKRLIAALLTSTTITAHIPVSTPVKAMEVETIEEIIEIQPEFDEIPDDFEFDIPDLDIPEIEIPDIEIIEEYEVLEEEPFIVPELIVTLNSDSFHTQNGYYKVDQDIYTSFEEFIQAKIDENDIQINQDYIHTIDNYTINILDNDWGARNNAEYSFTISSTINDTWIESEIITLNIRFSKFEQPTLTLTSNTMNIATIYSQENENINDPKTAKKLFSTILATQEDEENKVTLKYEHDNNFELITSEEFINNDTYSVEAVPVDTAPGQYQFIISKNAPTGKITTILNTNVISTFALRLKISEAEAAKASVVIGTNPATITNGVKFVDSTNMGNLESAITDAKTAITNALDQIMVDNAVTTLDSAITSFNSAIQYGTKGEIVDKSVLRATIQQAYDAKADVIYNESDVSFVPKGVKYVTSTEMNALVEKITAAETIRDNINATSTMASTASTELQTAIETFRALIKVGTYVGIDVSLLQAEIDKAYSAMEHDPDLNSSTENSVPIKVLPDGTLITQVEIDTKFVTESEMKTFSDAITLAEKERDNPDTNTTVNNATSNLGDAITHFTEVAIKTGTYIDVAQLQAKILEAHLAKDGIIVADKATDVEKGTKWVTSVEMSTFETSINTAEAKANAPDTVANVEAAIITLDDAITKFKQVAEDTLGAFIDFSALKTKISEAYLAKKGILVLDNKTPAEVDYQIKFLTSNQMKVLTDAIVLAEGKLTDPTITIAQVTQAITILEEAIATFEQAIQSGTFKTDLHNSIQKARAIIGESENGEFIKYNNEYSPQPIAEYGNIFVYENDIEANQVPSYVQYVLKYEFNDFIGIIQNAEDIFENNTINVDEINQAIDTLITEMTKFTDSTIKDGTFVISDKTEKYKSDLKDAIIAIENAIKDIYIADDSNPDYNGKNDKYIELDDPEKDVPDGVKYLLLSEFNEYFPYLSEAKEMIISMQSQADILSMTKLLKEQLTAFEIAKDKLNNTGTGGANQMIELQETIAQATALTVGWTEHVPNTYDLNSTTNNFDNLLVNDYLTASKLIKGTKFVTNTAYNQLEKAIAYAQEVENNPVNFETVQVAIDSLKGRAQQGDPDDPDSSYSPAIEGAMNIFENSIQIGTNVDFLVSKIETANTEKSTVVVIPDGTESEVEAGTKYVTATKMSTLQNAIDDALDVVNTTIDSSNEDTYTLTNTQSKTDALTNAISNFTDIRDNPTVAGSTQVDVSDLITQLEAAQITLETPTYNGTILPVNGYQVENRAKDQVSVGSYFVTLPEMDAFLVAIDDATDVLANAQDEDYMPPIKDSDIATAVDALGEAITAFNSAIEEGTLVESDLQALIVVAERAKTETADGNEIVVSISKNQISNTVYVATVDAMKALNNAIEQARATLSAPIERIMVISNTDKTAVEKLQDAIDAFYAEVTLGELDESALEAEIKNAHKAKAGLAVRPDSDNEADVENGIKFVTETEMNTFNALIKDYEKILYNAKIGGIESTDWPTDVDETSDIVVALQTAINAFVSSIKTGEKDTETGSKVALFVELEKISIVDMDGNDIVIPTDANDTGYIISKFNDPTGENIYRIDKQVNQVADTIQFITAQEMDELVAVYKLAKTVYDNTAATAAEVAEQTSALRNAYALYETRLKVGTVDITNLTDAQFKADNAVSSTEPQVHASTDINIVANDRTATTVDHDEKFVWLSEDEELDNAVAAALVMQNTLVTNLPTELNGETTVQDAVNAMETRLKAAYDPYFDSSTGALDTTGTQDIKVGLVIIGNAFDPANPTATPLPQDGSLNAIIKLAYEAKEGIWAIEDELAIPGKVQKDQKFVPLSQMQALDAAITAATTKATPPENTLDPIDLAVAIFDLQTAIDTFNDTPPMIGENDDSLEDLIAKAKELHATARIIDDVIENVEIGVVYVKTQADLDTLKAAILAAQEIIGDLSGVPARITTVKNDPTPVLDELQTAITLVLTGTFTTALDSLIVNIGNAVGAAAGEITFENIFDTTTTTHNKTSQFIELAENNAQELDIDVKYITTAEKELLEQALDYTQDILDEAILADTTDLSDRTPTLNALKQAFAPFTTIIADGGTDAEIKTGTAAFEPSPTTGENNLEDKLKNANEALTDTNGNAIISANKSVLNLDNQYYFVTSQIMNTLYNAIQNAPTSDIPTDPNDIAEYSVIVDTAINNFVPLQGQIDSLNLRNAIIKATNIFNGTLTNPSDSIVSVPENPEYTVKPTGTTADQVTDGELFVTQDDYDIFSTAITTAGDVIEAIKSDTGATHTQATVDAAHTTLTEAITTFYNDNDTDAVEEGTLTTTNLDSILTIAKAARDKTDISVVDNNRTTTTVDNSVKFVFEREKTELLDAIAAATELQTTPTNQDDIDAVIARLKAAYDPFFNSTEIVNDPDGTQEIKVGEAIIGDDAGDAGSLFTKILEAQAAKDGIIGIDSTVDQVEKGQKFVPVAQLKALNDAIDEVFDGTNIKQSDDTAQTTDVADAIATLDAAIKAFKATPPLVGTKVTGIIEAIEEAKLLKEGLRIIEKSDGTVEDEINVEKGVRYTSNLAITHLNAAIAAAQAIINDTSGVNRTSVSPMPTLQALKDAIEDFKNGSAPSDSIQINGIKTGSFDGALNDLMDGSDFRANSLAIDNDGDSNVGQDTYKFIISEVTDPSELDEKIKYVTQAEWELMETVRTHTQDILDGDVYADTTDLTDFTPTLNALKKALDPFRANSVDSGSKELKIGTAAVGSTNDTSVTPSLYGTIKAANEALKIDDNKTLDTTTFNNDVIATTKSVENLDNQYTFVTPEIMNALTSVKSIADLKLTQAAPIDIPTDINDIAKTINPIKDALANFKPATGKIDSSALRAEIEKATIMKNGDLSPDTDGNTANDATDEFTVKPNGTIEADVTLNEQFVTQDDFDTFEQAITTAEAVILAIKGDTGATHTQVTVDAAIAPLTAAITAFYNNTDADAVKIGTQNLDADGELQTEINKANAAKLLISSPIFVVANDRTSATVDDDVKFVFQSESDELDNAIDAAQALINLTPTDPRPSDAEVQAMILRLQKAYDPFFDTDPTNDPNGTQEIKVGEAIVGTSASDVGSLYTKWLEAVAAKDEIIGSDLTQAEVEKGQKFVPVAQMTALETAINKVINEAGDGAFDFVDDATGVINTAIDTADAIIALDKAIKDFKTVPPLVGTKITGIVEAIEEAKLLKEGLRIINNPANSELLENASNVEIGVRYVSSKEMADFNAAITAAQAIINDTSGVNKRATGSMPALEALQDAIELFKTTGIKIGTKITDLTALINSSYAGSIGIDNNNDNYAGKLDYKFIISEATDPSELDYGVKYVTHAEWELFETTKAHADLIMDGVYTDNVYADTTDLLDFTPTLNALKQALIPFYDENTIKKGTAQVSPSDGTPVKANDGTLGGTIKDADVALKIDDNLEPDHADYPTGDYPELDEIFINDIIATDKAVINLDKDRQFVTNAVMNALTNAKSRSEAKVAKVDDPTDPADNLNDPTDVAKAIKELTDALANFNPVAGEIDALNLNREILEAIARQNWKDNNFDIGAGNTASIEIKPTGTLPVDVTEGTFFITQDDWDAFDNAIKAAQAVITGIQSDEGGTYTQVHVDEVDANLQALVDTFELKDAVNTNGVIQTGTRSTSDLDNYIEIAKEAVDLINKTDATQVHVLDNDRTPTTVDTDELFVLESEKTELDNALAAAQELKTNPTNQADIDTMIARLTTAVKPFLASDYSYTPTGGTTISITGTIKTGTIKVSPDSGTEATATDGTLEGTVLSAKAAKKGIIATDIVAENVQNGQRFVSVGQMKIFEEIIKPFLEDDANGDLENFKAQTDDNTNPTDIADKIQELKDAIETFNKTEPKQGIHTTSIQAKIDEAEQTIADGLKEIDKAPSGDQTADIPAEEPGKVEKGTKYLSTTEMIDLKNAISIAKAAIEHGEKDVTLLDNTPDDSSDDTTQSTSMTSPNDLQTADDPLHTITAIDDALDKIQTGTFESSEFTNLLAVAKAALESVTNETKFATNTYEFNTGIFVSSVGSDSLPSFTLRNEVYFVEAEDTTGADLYIAASPGISSEDKGGYFITTVQVTALKDAISYAEGNKPDDFTVPDSKTPIIKALADALDPFKVNDSNITNNNEGTAKVGADTDASGADSLYGKLKDATGKLSYTVTEGTGADATTTTHSYITSDKSQAYLDKKYKYVTTEMKVAIDTAIETAKQITLLGADTEDPNDVAEAINALKTAITNYKPIEGIIDSTELRSFIEKANAIKNDGQFTDSDGTIIEFIVKPDDTIAGDVEDGIYFVKEGDFQTFLDAITVAEDIIEAIKNNDSTTNYTQADVDVDPGTDTVTTDTDATQTLQKAINAFIAKVKSTVSGDDTTGTTSLTALKDAIAEAETAIRDTLEDSSSDADDSPVVPEPETEKVSDRIYILGNDRIEETVDIDVKFVTLAERDRLDLALAAAKALLDEIELDLRPSMILSLHQEITTAEQVSKVTTELKSSTDPFKYSDDPSVVSTGKKGKADIGIEPTLTPEDSSSDDGSLWGAIIAAELLSAVDIIIVQDDSAETEIPAIELGKKYILQSQLDTLLEAIDVAKIRAEETDSAVANDITLPTDVADEIITLDKAIETFKSQIGIGAFDNSRLKDTQIYNDLDQAIRIDRILVHGTTVIAQGEQPPDEFGYWIESGDPVDGAPGRSLARTITEKTTFEDAIKTAEYKLYTAKTEEALEQAKKELDDVYAQFVDQLRWGFNSTDDEIDFSLNIVRVPSGNSNVSFIDKAEIEIEDIYWTDATQPNSSNIAIDIHLPAGANEFPVIITPKREVVASLIETNNPGVIITKEKDTNTEPLEIAVAIDELGGDDKFTIELSHDFGETDELYPIERTLTFNIVETPENPGFSDLETRLDYAKEVMNTVKIGTAANAYNNIKVIASNKKDELVALRIAINNASQLTSSANTNTIQIHIGHLTKAIANLYAGATVSTGSGGATPSTNDFNNLKTAIENAQALADLTVLSSNGSGVATTKYWANQTNLEAFHGAIVDANAALSNTTDNYARAKTALDNALKNFIDIDSLKWNTGASTTWLGIQNDNNGVSISNLNDNGTDQYDSHFTSTFDYTNKTITVPFRTTTFDATINAMNTDSNIKFSYNSGTPSPGSLAITGISAPASASASANTFNVDLSHDFGTDSDSVDPITTTVEFTVKTSEPTNAYLQAKIEDAETLKRDTHEASDVNSNGSIEASDVDTGVNYVTPTEASELQDAIDDAISAKGTAANNTTRTSALLALESAITDFEVADDKTGTARIQPASGSAGANDGTLEGQILQANARKTDVLITPETNVANVASSQKFISQTNLTALEGEILTATSKSDDLAIADDVATAIKTLNEKIAFVKVGELDQSVFSSNSNYTNLQTAITNAEDILNATEVSSDGSGIIDKYWTAQDKITAFKEAINNAKVALYTATSSTVNSLSTTTLENAQVTFVDALKWDGTTATTLNYTELKITEKTNSSETTAPNDLITGNTINLAPDITGFKATFELPTDVTISSISGTGGLNVTNLSNIVTVTGLSHNDYTFTITLSHTGSSVTITKDINFDVIVAPGFRAALPDAGLRSAIVEHNPAIVFDEEGKVDVAQLEQLEGEFYATNASIENLEGLQYATNLTGIHVDDNNITDISVLSGLPNLQTLSVNNNELEALNLTDLGGVTELYATNNNISNLEFMQARTLSKQLNNLKVLDLSGNPALRDISVVENFADSLTELNLSGNTEITNGISSIGALTNLENLEVDSQLLTDQEKQAEFVDALADLTIAQQNNSSNVTVIIDSDNIADTQKADIQNNVDYALKVALQDKVIEKFPEIIKTAVLDEIIEQEYQIENEIVYTEDDYDLEIDPIKTSMGVTTLEFEIAPKQPTGKPNILVRAKDILSSITNVVKNALSRNNAPKVILDVDTKTTVEGVEVSLDPQALEILADENNSTLELETDFATLSIDAQALNQILADAKDDYITFSISNYGALTSRQQSVIKNNDVLFLDAYTQGDSFLKFEDNITVITPYKLEKDETGANVYYVDDNGKTQKLDSSYRVGKLSFNINQFAEFMIVPTKTK